MSPSLRTNVIAKDLGNGWVALVSLAVVPGYLWWLGAEGLGLILFSATLQGLCSLLDFGLIALVTREAAYWYRRNSLPVTISYQL